jgi:hypothetical protein
MSDAACGVRRPIQAPSAVLLARLAPLTPVPGRPDLVAHQAPDLLALWQAWEAWLRTACRRGVEVLIMVAGGEMTPPGLRRHCACPV